MANLPPKPPSLQSPASSPTSNGAETAERSPSADRLSALSAAASSSAPSSSPGSLLSPRGAVLSGAGLLSDGGMWLCPFDCGQRYKRSSGRSIRRHVNACFRAHNPSAVALTDEQLSGVISQQQASGQLITGLRRWKMRQPRRMAEHLKDEDRWDCLWGCGKSYRATSSRSIQRHANSCYLRPDGQSGNVDVKGLKEQSTEQRKKRREDPDGRVESGNSSMDDGADSQSGGNSPSELSAPYHRPRSNSSAALTTSSFPSVPAPAYNMRDIDQHHALLDEQAGRWGGDVDAQVGPQRSVKVEPQQQQKQQADNHAQHHQHSHQSSRSAPSPYSQPRALPLGPHSSHQQAQPPSHSQSQFHSSMPSTAYHSQAAPLSSSSASSSPFDRPPYTSAWPPPQLAFLSNHAALPWLSSSASSASGEFSASQHQLPPQQKQQQQQKPLALHHYQQQQQQQQHQQPNQLQTHNVSPMPSLQSVYPPFPPPPLATSYPSASSLSTASMSSSPPSLSASPPLPATDYRSLYEREQQVSDELRTLVSHLYNRHGLHHPVFQQRIVSPQLIQQAIHASAADSISGSAVGSTSASTFAPSHPALSLASSPPSAVQPPDAAGVDWNDDYGALLSRFLQSTAAQAAPPTMSFSQNPSSYAAAPSSSSPSSSSSSSAHAASDYSSSSSSPSFW